MTVRGAGGVGFLVEDQSEPFVRRLRVVGATLAGIVVDGAQARWETIEVEASAGVGVVVRARARVEIVGLTVRSAHDDGVHVADAALTLTDLEVEDSGSDGVHAVASADVTLRRARVRANTGAGCAWRRGQPAP